MKNFTISADFIFDTHKISSMEGFRLDLTIKVDDPRPSHEQHVYIKNKLRDELGLTPHDVPKAWGDNPPHYEEIGFTVEDPVLIKHLISLLKEGGGAENPETTQKVVMTAMGRRYPSDSDHPLFETIEIPENLPDDLTSFASLYAFIEQTIFESQDKSSVSNPRPERRAPKPHNG